MTSCCRQTGLGKIGPHAPILAPTKPLGFALVLRFDQELRVRYRVGRKYKKAQAGPPAEGSSPEPQRAKQVCMGGARGSWTASGSWVWSSSPRRGLVAGIWLGLTIPFHFLAASSCRLKAAKLLGVLDALSSGARLSPQSGRVSSSVEVERKRGTEGDDPRSWGWKAESVFVFVPSKSSLMIFGQVPLRLGPGSTYYLEKTGDKRPLFGLRSARASAGLGRRRVAE